MQGEAHQEKVRNLETALMQVEAVSKARLEELMTLTEKEIAAVRGQKDALQATLFSTQADLAVTNQLKTQLAEYQAMEGLCNSEVKKLHNELKMMTDTQTMLRRHLAESRERELALESRLHSDSQQQETTVKMEEGAEGSGLDQCEAKADSSAVALAPSTVPTQSVTAHHQADLQQELDDARSNINDLISEIEAVAAEEVKARSQSGRLLRQIADYQSMQRVALEENLRLQNQIEDIKLKYAETESRFVLQRGVLTRTDCVWQDGPDEGRHAAAGGAPGANPAVGAGCAGGVSVCAKERPRAVERPPRGGAEAAGGQAAPRGLGEQHQLCAQAQRRAAEEVRPPVKPVRVGAQSQVRYSHWSSLG